MSNSFDQEFDEASRLYQKTLEELKISQETCSKFESDTHPMSPNLYFQLCSVRGFQKLNGKDYPTYLAGWKERFSCAKKGREALENSSITTDEYMYTLATC